ncbi:MAG: DUF4416 family protein [Thermodesulfobacteriota bacterium]
MSILLEPSPARFFVGLIYNKRSKLRECIDLACSYFGEIIFESEEFDFNQTNYYEKETGQNLKRKFVFFKNLIKRTEIIQRKIITNTIETEFSVNEKRTINIDPGYIAPEHLILATGKGYSHRSYLGSGVYADITLIFENNGFKILEWTYPDYKSVKIQDMFLRIRKDYLNELKERNLI